MRRFLVHPFCQGAQQKVPYARARKPPSDPRASPEQSCGWPLALRLSASQRGGEPLVVASADLEAPSCEEGRLPEKTNMAGDVSVSERVCCSSEKAHKDRRHLKHKKYYMSAWEANFRTVWWFFWLNFRIGKTTQNENRADSAG